MPNDYFRFKKFTIQQSKCAMKVGTDGVLLGAWVSVKNCHNILDVGTGTGLIALMLAQRSNAIVDGIDIDGDAVIQATENASSSPFKDRVNIYHLSFDDYSATTKQLYDLIVSNPPYFKQSLKSPDNKRTIARHTDNLSFTELIENGKSLLTSDGRIAFILPAKQEKELIDCLHANQMKMIRKTVVFPTPNAQPKRLLVEISKIMDLTCEEDELIIEKSRHVYTDDYTDLTAGFYLSKSAND